MSAVTQEGRSAMQVASGQQELNTVVPSNSALILDVASMDSIMSMATMMAKGRSTIPAHLADNASDCAAVIMQALNWRMNPWAVAQKTHVVNGALGYEAQLVNAVIQSSGVTEDRFNYDWYGPWEKIVGKSKIKQLPQVGQYGDKRYRKASECRVPDYRMQDEDGLGVKISATLKGEAEPRVLSLLLVQASVRNSPLWATDPKQQLAYLAVKRWARLYAPDVILGVYTPDELEEGNRQARDITPRTRGCAGPAPADASTELMIQAQAAAGEGLAAYSTFWSDVGAASRKALGAQHEGFKADAARADQARTVDALPANPAQRTGEIS